MSEQRDRDTFINRVKYDFTYKYPLTDEQLEALRYNQAIFENYKARMHHLFEDSRIPEYVTARKRMREAHRWANTAVANDWTPDFTPDVKWEEIPLATLYLVDYDLRVVDNALEKDKLCHEVTHRTYNLAVSLAMQLPHGRALSVCMTKLQEVRGELLDAINFNVEE